MMNCLRRYAMAIICGLAMLGFGTCALLSAGLVERGFWLVGCVLNAVLFGSWWAIERTFANRERAAEVFAASLLMIEFLGKGQDFTLNGRVWTCSEGRPQKPPAETGEEGAGT